MAFLLLPTLDDSNPYKKSPQLAGFVVRVAVLKFWGSFLRALLLAGGEAVLNNVGRVLDVVKFFHPISCGCDDGCEEFVVLQDCFHKQSQFVGAVQSCELSKHLDIAEVFFKRS